MQFLAPFRRHFFLLPILCIAEPDADPQYTNNAPFSGAIYIVNPNGESVNAAGTNYCPSYASVSCANMGSPSWCCPASYTCASPPNSGGLIGCCPSGSTCGGNVNVASITTVTVQAVQQTSYVYVQPQPTTVAVYNAPTTQVVAQGGFCSTLTMSGPGLPTTRQGDCGTILVVNEGYTNFKPVGYGIGAIAILLHLALARMFGAIHWL
ncbi:uncharacterized protein BDR25DRAFT_265439 [Lindgomyces ingoldianus]|uniref:Uncharacterized protein n=1 Tax=Lindgomyces ingoldianus TaxID=673940 RepID=A0ACB6QNR6_9PLEO|nr:uncharacterized protein BDR25DRAFT_265439 [Lindgomyces ingoldianus]KAF2468643.1 hypothetical protein BDR25DRAFT_265439 [Lindgomyces ingoldianus]